MPYKHPELQSNDPYYDDFEDTKNFLKVLFKPGYSVQARELTQLQTILQSQISKFADHVFLDGSQIIGGKVNISPANFVRVNKNTTNSSGVLQDQVSDTYLNSIKRTNISYEEVIQTNQILGTVQKTQLEIFKYDADTETYASVSSGTIMLLHYEEAGYSAEDDYTVLFFLPITGADDGIGANDLLKVKGADTHFKVIDPQLANSVYTVSPYGTANIVSVDDGLFYLDGLFVKNNSQILVPWYDSTDPNSTTNAFTEDGLLSDNANRNTRLFAQPSVRVGFIANKSAVTVLEDTTLRDPANGFYNSNAPGADRYVINLVLEQLPFDPQSIDIENYSNTNFIQLARLVNGKVDWIRRLTNYSELLEIFARRTYDESGSYTVIPFQVETKNHLRDDFYEIIVQNTPLDFKIGTYVFSASAAINPFAENLSTSGYGILEVISITPYDDLLAQESSSTNISPSIVKLRAKTSIRLAFDVGSSTNNGYGKLNYRPNTTGANQVINVKLLSYQIDPMGAYSPQDIPIGDAEKMVLAVQPGKAYVYGYEYETNFPKNVEYLKKNNESRVNQEMVVSSSSVLGNYVIGSFANDLTPSTTTVQWEKLPKFKLNSDELFVLIMDEGSNTSVSAPIYSWSPYRDWVVDDDDSKKMQGDPLLTNRQYESVLFVKDGTFNSTFYAGDNVGACNNRTTPYNYIAGEITQNKHQLHLISANVTDIVRASFLEAAGITASLHRDFNQAYDPRIQDLGTVGLLSTTSNKFLVKQLNSTGDVAAQGHCLRWVAGDIENRTDGYIKRTSGTFISVGNNAGVLFQYDQATGTSSSWGSSITRISQLNNIFKFQLTTIINTNDPIGQTEIPVNYGGISGTGILSEINIRKISDNNLNGVIVANGYIFSVLGVNGNPLIPEYLYVHILDNPQNVPFSIGSDGTREIDTIDYAGTNNYLIESSTMLDTGSPCFRYQIQGATKQDVGIYSDRFKRVEFRESGLAGYADYDVSQDNPTTYQWAWDISATDPLHMITSKPWAWIKDQSALYLEECGDVAHEQRYGPIYQQVDNALVAWGNRSFSECQFEPLNGRFVNIEHSTTNNYEEGKDYNEDWNVTGGESLVQVLERELSYDTDYNYVIGDKIFQIRSTDDYDYASATVVSWEYPDLTNPSDNSPMKLVARIDITGPDQPGNYIDIDTFQTLKEFKVGTTGGGETVSSFVYGGKIIPYSTLNLTSTIANEWLYEVNNTNTFFTTNKDLTDFTSLSIIKSDTPLPITIGTTRIRNISLGPTPQASEDDVLYKFYLFDTHLTETNNTFGDVTDIIYDDGNATIKNITKIAPLTGRRIVEEVFSGTNQTIETRKTTIFDPAKDKLFFRLPVGNIFEEVVKNGFSVELQKIFNFSFSSGTSEWQLNDDDFLVSEPNVNWFVVDADTGVTYNLVETDAPEVSLNQLGYVFAEGTGSIVIHAPDNFEANVTLFAKTITTITVNNIRKKILTTNTETLSGFTKGTRGALKNQYYMELMNGSQDDAPRGNINTIVTVYTTTVSGSILTGTSNIISSFILDTGITDQKITRPKLILGSAHIKPNGMLDGSIFGAPGTEVDPTTITLKITYEYYRYTEDSDSAKVSTRESFIDINNTVVSNSDVPFYFSKNSGEVIHESAIIDFRPNTLKPGDDFFMGSTKFTPHPDWADTIDVNYYLPRRDKLVLTKNGKFEILYGKPALSPKYPSDIVNAMSLYTIEKDPFIFGPSSMKMKMIDNRRYTMRDIGKIEKRVQKLEYYTTLSIMEKKAEDMLVLDANGNDRFKNGILVDTFEGHKIGDVTNRDYNVSVDFNRKFARPPFITHTNNLIKNPSGSTTFYEVSGPDTNITTGLFMFPYTEKVFVAQPLATRAITVQPHDTIQYEGLVTLLPIMDTWVSTIRRPNVNVNLAGENDAWNQMVGSFNNNNIAPFGTQWGEWETLSRSGTRTVIDSETSSRVVEDWHLVRPGHSHGGTGAGRDARTIENTTVNTILINEELEQARNGITRTLSTSTTDISLGDRIVDVRIVPFMRNKNIKISVKGMKPKTRVYVFFDGVNVAEYCYKLNTQNELFGILGTDIGGTQFSFPGTNFPISGGGSHFATSISNDLKTNDNGDLFIEFRMPDGIFRVGDRKFEVTSDPRNDKERASTYASGVYSASGLRTEVEETIATTRNFQISDPIQSSDSRTTNLTGIFQETSSTTTVQTRQNDPLAQTFFVNASEHPEGIFLSSVDIFFARKPEDSTNIPVQIQIRPAVNGYPDSTRIYPGAKVIKQPSEIEVSEDASIKTNFQFDHPIHLPPGEHALVVKGDTSEYEIFIATLGDFILGTETKVTNQPYVGVFFTSANASTWSPEQNTDMMMVLNKCEFVTGQSYNLVLKNEHITTENKFELFNINSRYFDFNSCRSSWLVNAITVSGSNKTIAIEPNTDIELSDTYSYGTREGSTSTENNFDVVITALTTNKDVSPVIDLQSLSFFAINNKVEGNDSSNNGELEPFVPNNLVGATPRARYISRVVTLEDGFDSSNMKCVLSLNKPIGTNIQVFVKMQESQSTDDFHSFGYSRLTPNVPNFDTYYTEAANEFREVEFSLPQDTTSPFNRFCVKICFYSDQPWNVPKIRDMRAIAVL